MTTNETFGHVDLAGASFNLPASMSACKTRRLRT